MPASSNETEQKMIIELHYWQTIVRNCKEIETGVIACYVLMMFLVQLMSVDTFL